MENNLLPKKINNDTPSEKEKTYAEIINEVTAKAYADYVAMKQKGGLWTYVNANGNEVDRYGNAPEVKLGNKK